MDMTTYLEGALLDHVLRNTAYTSPATVYLALFTTATTEGGGGTEVTGGSYARQSIPFTAPAGSPASVANSADISFPVATAGWGTITHVAIFDALTVGNMLYHGALSSSVLVGLGDQFEILTGNLTVQHD